MKRLLPTVRIAFRALQVNRVRSALTMLGIVIGVAAVIATIAVGTGATQRIEQQIASIGSNVIIILPGSITASGVRLGTGIAITLSEADARELTSQCPDIAAASPVVRGRRTSRLWEQQLGNDNDGCNPAIPNNPGSDRGRRRCLQSAGCGQHK